MSTEQGWGDYALLPGSRRRLDGIRGIVEFVESAVEAWFAIEAFRLFSVFARTYLPARTRDVPSSS